MTVIHLSFDFPDSIVPEKTKAVFNLVQSQTQYLNYVFSLNRSASLSDDFKPKKEDFGISMNVFGLPFGLGLNVWMYLISLKIERIIKREKIEVSVIHAHKLTFEGLIAYHLSKKLKIPYILTIRGDSDLRIVRSKKECRMIYKMVVEKASKVIFLAPWSIGALEHFFPSSSIRQNSELIPNIIEVSKRLEPIADSDTTTFLTVFNFDSYKRKNIKRVIRAFDNLHATYPQLKLHIVGSGSQSAVNTVQGYANSCKHPDTVKLLGQKDHDEVLALYSNYLAFILPSYPETFGLVFIEALNGGLPIIYAERSGVDGYFDGLLLGMKVPWNQTHKIQKAVEEIFLNKQSYSQTVRQYVEGGGLEIFSKKSVSEKYTRLLTKVLEE